jgi:hypothetical protein
LQALSLQNNTSSICLYNEAVSINFLKKHFRGKLFPIKDVEKFTQKKLFPLSKLFSKKSKKLHVFLGNKQNFWSTYITNQLSIKHINILDDGLSSYGISKGIYKNTSTTQVLIKKSVKCVYSIFGWEYFNEANNSEIDRACNAYYFFPELIKQSQQVNKIQIKGDAFHYYSSFSTKTTNEELVHIASFDESTRIVNEKNTESNIRYILHPRVLGKPTDIPTEIILYHSDKVALSASSLILYLVFIGYKGEYILKDKESENLLSFFKQ